MSNFEVIDRRGQHKPEPVEQKPEELTPSLVKKGERTWEDVRYGIAIAQDPQGNPLLLGRACGLRSDGEVFIADWMIAPLIGEHEHFQELTKKRLDTFLDCECASHKQCVNHKQYIPQWQQQDIQRMNLMMTQPQPKVLQVMEAAEKARQAAKPNIVIPR